MTDTNISTLPNLITLTGEESDDDSLPLPNLTPITEEDTDEDNEEDTDDDYSSMPDLIPCTPENIFKPLSEEDCYSTFGCDFKNIQQEPLIDYNDEEIEKREERYEQWTENRIRTLNQPYISPLFKQNYKEE